MATIYIGNQAVRIKDAKYADANNTLHDCRELVINGVRIFPSTVLFLVSSYEAVSFADTSYDTDVKVSTNNGVASSTAYVSFKISGTTVYGIYVISDGEKEYDYVSITITDENNKTVYSKSCKSNEYGELLSYSKLNDLDTYKVVVTYIKNGTGNAYTDRGYVMLHARYKDTNSNVQRSVDVLKGAYRYLNAANITTLTASKTQVAATYDTVSLSATAKSGFGEALGVTYRITSGSEYASMNGSLLVVYENDTDKERTVVVEAVASNRCWPSSDKSSATTLTATSNSVTIKQAAGTKKHKVTFRTNVANATCHTSEMTVVDGGTISSLPVASLSGHFFYGWWTNATMTGGGSLFTTETTVTRDIILYAIFEKRTYTFTVSPSTLSFGSKSDSKNITITSKYKLKYIDSGDGLDVPAELPSGWTAEKSASWLTLSQSSGSSGTTLSASVTANSANSARSDTIVFKNKDDSSLSVSVTVTQQEFRQQYKITFNKNGGTGSVPPDIVLDGDSATSDITQDCPTRDGYDFRGWSGTTDYSSTRIAWSSSYGGGADANGIKATQTSSWNIATYLKNVGLQSKDLTTSGEYKVLTLYAQWEKKATSHTIHIEPASGCESMFNALRIDNSTGPVTRDVVVDVGASVTFEAYMNRGYKFSYFYWNNTQYGVNPWTKTNVTSDMSILIYAVAYSYKITFDANGGSGIPSDVSFGDVNAAKDIGSTVPTRSGYKFIGWSAGKTTTSPRISYNKITSSSNGSSVTTSSSWTIYDYLSNLSVTDSVFSTSGNTRTLTLYAQWESEEATTYTATLSGSNVSSFYWSTDGSNFTACSNTMPMTKGNRYYFKASAKSGYEIVSHTIRYGSSTSSGTTLSGDTAEIYASDNTYITFNTQATSSGGGGSTGSKSCTVDLNSQWEYVSTVTDSDGVTYKMYKSKTTANSGISKMKVTWTGNSAFKVKLWSDSEAGSVTSISTSVYDYAIALNAETAVASSFDPLTNKSDIKAHTKGIGNAAGAPTTSNSGKWVTANYSGSSNGYAWILYRKDSSISKGNDCGYLMIPSSANITN